MAGFVKKVFPPRWRWRLQRLQALGVSRWIRRRAGQPFALTDQSALVVAPHQDDETFGCGGLIALKRARGAAVRVVFLTDGAAAPRPVSGMGGPDWVALRQCEALDALAILGVGEDCAHFLGLPDAALPALAEDPAARAPLRDLLARHRPEEIYVTHRRDRHPDHEAAYRITAAAIAETGIDAELYEYPIWMWWKVMAPWRLAAQMWTGAACLSIEAAAPQKRRAIGAYPSQCATLPTGFLDQFLQSFEIFFCARGRPRQ